jgi:hypothetical protein
MIIRFYRLRSLFHGALLAGCAALLLPAAGSRAAPSDEAALWRRAGDVRGQERRGAVVRELREAGRAHRRRAAARARLLKLPLREELPDGRVREIIGWEGRRPLYYTTLNANAAISTGANLLRAEPYLADGAGWTVGIWDGGSVRTTHRELTGRVTSMDGASPDYHATHVGGTIAATGVTATARGMAIAAHIDSYDWNDDSSEMSSRGASYGGEPGKIALSNHSYGYISGWDRTGSPSPAWIWYGSGTTAAGFEEEFGKYNSYVRNIDSRAYSLPYYLIFWAAGNDRSDNPSAGAKVALDPNDPYTVVAYDPAQHPGGDGAYRGGYENIAFEALGKNVVSIGAVKDAVTGGARDPAKAAMTTFSCWGPTDDGRIKPDLVANGYSLYSSTSSGDAAYATMSGTSMATPNATGTALLLLDLHGRLFPGQYLRASTLKGLLIHTADDLGTPGPDYGNGWGLINGLAAADLLAAMQADPAVPRMIEQQLTTLVTTRSHPFTWDGVSPIRVTLCWTDPAGVATTAADSRTPRLVNNLDLRVTGPSGSVHLPWVMPFVGTWTPESMSEPATTGTNDTDNVEQVYIADPPVPGEYQAVVSFSGLLSNSPQHYSLLVSGATRSPPDPQTLSPDCAETGGQSELAITGEDFAEGATAVFYRDGQPEVAATVSNVTPTAIACTLDTTAMVPGAWSLRVTNPDGKTGTLAGALAVVATLHGQSFDAGAPGWSATRTTGTGSPGWILTTAQSHSPSNAYFCPGPAQRVTDNLISEPFALSATAQRLRLHFWHTYDMETCDGGLLEVSPDDGATWYETGPAGTGASFVQGGYTTTIARRFFTSNRYAELYGKPAWTGSGGSQFAEVVVALDTAVYGGATLRARWRLSTDNSTASPGWHVDSVRIAGYDTANAAPIIVAQAAADPTNVTGTATSLSVSAIDDGGSAALAYTWSADAPPEHPVAFAANGTNTARQTTATFSAPGSYPFLVTVMDAEGLAATSGVAVTVQPTPSSIGVAPAAAEVESDRQQLFAAEARDQFGGLLVPQPAFAWSVEGGGSIDTNGLFTANTATGGPYTVTASALGLQGHASVTVVAPPPVYWALGVEASPSEGGTASGSGIYLEGTRAPLAAAPAEGWLFRYWSGSGIADTNAATTTVLMDADKLATAHFEPIPPPPSNATILMLK